MRASVSWACALTGLLMVQSSDYADVVHGATPCANEGEFCICPAGNQVAYGAHGTWTKATNPYPTQIKCTANAFGGTAIQWLGRRHNDAASKKRCVCVPALEQTASQPPLKSYLPEGEATKVAVCVAGMPSRLHPEALLRSVVAANAPGYTFDVIYALQPPAASMYYSSTREKLGLGTQGNLSQSRFHAVGSEDAIATIIRDLEAEIRRDVANKAAEQGHAERMQRGRTARIHVLKFIRDRSSAEWHSHLELASNQKLDRITQFIEIQWRVLNMYQHQVVCAEKIRELEASRGIRFDYIISTREDIWFWNTVDLAALTSGGLIRGSGDVGPAEGHKSHRAQAVTPCDIVTKNCLAWNGINMRFQLLRRELGFHFLHNRLKFYKSMYNHSKCIWNTEQFELIQARQIGMTTCPRTVTELPAVPARRLAKTDGASEHPICFFEKEIQGCFPPLHEQHVRDHFCDPLTTEQKTEVITKYFDFDDCSDEVGQTGKCGAKNHGLPATFWQRSCRQSSCCTTDTAGTSTGKGTGTGRHTHKHTHRHRQIPIVS